MRAEARDYLALARRALDSPETRLIAVGGLSGSGKSTLARALAPLLGPPPGALVVRSDEARKHLFEVAMEAPLPPEAYAPEVSGRVYRFLRERARRVLAAGRAVIVDAVHDRAESRAGLAALAAETKAPFLGLWLEVCPETLARRIEVRRNDASDATVEVMRRQHRRAEIPEDWRRLDGEGGAEAVIAQARRALAGLSV